MIVALGPTARCSTVTLTTGQGSGSGISGGAPGPLPLVLAFSPVPLPTGQGAGQGSMAVLTRFRIHHTRKARILAQRGSQRAEGGAGDLMVLSPVRLWGTSRCRGRAEVASNPDSRMWPVRESRR